MSLPLLMLSAALAAAPSGSRAPASIDIAWVQRRSQRSATLVLREADSRLMARCFDPEGLDPDEVERTSEAMTGTEVSLFLGPRRIARGEITGVETAADPLLPCAVTVLADFDRPLPILARGDVLWATNRALGSTPREPVRPEVVERARAALPEKLNQACLSQKSVARRGTKRGTYVGFTCPMDSAVSSAVVFVPKSGQPDAAPRLVLTEAGDYGTLSLVEVLDPRSEKGHRLVMLREWDEIELRRLEIWDDDGTSARTAASEALAEDMMFLAGEDARRRRAAPFGDAFDTDGGDDDAAASVSSEEDLPPGTIEGMPIRLMSNDGSGAPSERTNAVGDGDASTNWQSEPPMSVPTQQN